MNQIWSDSKNRNIRKRVLVPLTLTFLVLICTFIYSGVQIRKNQSQDEMYHRYQSVQKLYFELLQQQSRIMDYSSAFLMREQSLQQAMFDHDRERLLLLSRPHFKQFTRRYGITHLYYHNRDGTTFLRVHHPSKYGDMVKRQTFWRAHKSNSPLAGLEIGPLGTFTYRAVFPWKVEGQVIGYLELGVEINHIMVKLADISHMDFLLTLNKNFLNRQLWEDGMRMLGRPADWSILPDQVIVDQTIPSISIDLQKKGMLTYGVSPNSFLEVSLGEESYRSKSFPLLDYKSEKVGNIIVLDNITLEKKRFFDFVLRITIISFVLCSTLFAFAYGILGRMDKRLVKTRRLLHRQIDKATRINQKLAVEITERNRAESDLQQLNTNLEERVFERTSDLETLNMELNANRRELEDAYQDLKAKQAEILHQDKMAGIGQLAAGVAHDINNPIGFVSNNLEELGLYITDLTGFIDIQSQALKRFGEGENIHEWTEKMRDDLAIESIVQDIHSLLEESHEGVGRVTKIVNNLRTFARIDDNDYESVSLVDCLESTINITWNELRYKAEIIRKYESIPEIECYPGQINQVFMNLLLNASQAIDNFGEITIRTWTEAKNIWVSITDTGCGIPEETASKIFDPFFTTKEIGKGTGLGLSISYDIIKNHQGEITLDTEVGKGTTFTIRLPVE